MDIEYYKMVDGEEVVVSTWREADSCIISCNRETRQEDLLEAGMWLEKHKRTIADYALNEAYGDTPWVEVFKARKG